MLLIKNNYPHTYVTSKMHMYTHTYMYAHVHTSIDTEF